MNGEIKEWEIPKARPRLGGRQPLIIICIFALDCIPRGTNTPKWEKGGRQQSEDQAGKCGRGEKARKEQNGANDGWTHICTNFQQFGGWQQGSFAHLSCALMRRRREMGMGWKGKGKGKRRIRVPLQRSTIPPGTGTKA